MIIVYGGRGTGKTAVCRRLHDTYVNRLHVAMWPMTGRPASSPDARGDASGLLASRPLAALAWLVHELNAEVPRFGRIAFPRFTYGLVAATVVEASPDPATQVGAGPSVQALADFQEHKNALLAALASAPGHTPVGRRFGAFAEAVIPLVSWLAPALAPLEELLRQFARQAADGTKLHTAALRWWDGQRLGVPGTGIEKVLRYAQALGYRVAADGRGELERRLTAAFLADIDAYYRRVHLLSRPLPLILLDDTHTGTPARVLDLLLNAYAAAGGHGNAQGARISRPVIVATRLGPGTRPAAPGDRHHPVEVSQIDTLVWRSPDSDAAGDWQVRLAAPALRADGIAPALGADCPRGLPNLIEQISAGRAGLAWPLVEAAERDLAAGAHSALRRRGPAELGPALLALPPAGPPAPDRPPAVADVLLRYLVPDPELIGPLLRRAVAVTRNEIPVPAAGAEQDAEQDQVSAFLRAEHWERTPWAGDGGTIPPVSDRALRELLLYRLRAECTPARGGPDAHGRWTRSHSAAAEDPHSPPAVRLHHALALGRRERVVSELHTLFDRMSRPAWLAAVQTVCAAPHPPDGYAEDHPEPPDLCPACPGPLPDGRHRAISRLVTLLWGLSTLASLYTDDPDAPNNRLTALLNSSDLADDEGVMSEAARRWPAQLSRGRRVPELPIPIV
ncbi:hypothetical protein [Streptomyces sp. NPDC006134]|uniref:hypothetical protein n=1 Tax=Streptomyces sp. NPDC006134 TaxID=3154467 RepID=UPI0033DDBD21